MLFGCLPLLVGLYGAYLLVLAAFLRSEQTILKRELAEEVELKLAPPPTSSGDRRWRR